MDFMSHQQLNSIFLNTITSEEITSEINELKSSKAVGPFSIPVNVNILKLTKYIISKPLGPDVRMVDSIIHRIAIFSTVVKMLKKL